MSSTSSNITLEMNFQIRKEDKVIELGLVSMEDAAIVQSYILAKTIKTGFIIYFSN